MGLPLLCSVVLTLSSILSRRSCYHISVLLDVLEVKVGSSDPQAKG